MVFYTFAEFYPSWDSLPLLDPVELWCSDYCLPGSTCGSRAVKYFQEPNNRGTHKSGHWDLSGPNARSNKKLPRSDMMKLQYRDIIRAGAIFSSFGTALLILFLIILLSFPVEKDCSKHQRCEFYSKAPEPLNYLVSPNFVVTTLFVISAGILVMRFAKRYSNRV